MDKFDRFDVLIFLVAVTAFGLNGAVGIFLIYVILRYIGMKKIN